MLFPSKKGFPWKSFQVCAAFALSMALVSCLGAASRIQLKKDGSGTFGLEYRMNRELERLGKLDGNEKWLSVPAGKADLERTAARIPGLKLLSFKIAEEGQDMICRAEFSFDSPEALAAFFDASGQRFSIDLPGKRMRFGFDSGPAEIETSFRELAEESFRGYEFSLSLELPGKAAFDFFDERGNVLYNVPGTCAAEGQALRYTVSMAEMIFAEKPFIMEIRW